MFERFTNRARNALVIARDEALALGHNYLGPEHILLGLIGEGEGVGARALASVGVTAESARQLLRDRPAEDAQTGRRALGQKPPFTPLAKRTLEDALREALGLKHNYIGTEHILLAVCGQGEGGAHDVLTRSGVDREVLRQRVLEILSGYPGSNSEDQRPPATRSAPDGPRLSAGMAQIMEGAAAQPEPGRPVTSAEVLCAMVEAPDSHAGRVLAALGVTPAKLCKRLEEIPVEGTTDAPPAPEITISVAGTTTTIRDAEVAALLQHAGPDEIGDLLRRLLDSP